MQIREKALAKLQSLGRPRRKMIDAKIQDLLLDFRAYSKQLSANLVGLRSAHAGKDRIVFVVCEECKREGWMRHNIKRCRDQCGVLPDDTLLILKIGHRKNIYDKI